MHVNLSIVPTNASYRTAQNAEKLKIKRITDKKVLTAVRCSHIGKYGFL